MSLAETQVSLVSIVATGELDFKRDKNGQRRGRSNKKAGRKPNGPRAGVSHRPRKPIDRRHPQHVTLRVVREIGWLRQLDMYAAVRRALRASAIEARAAVSIPRC